MANTPSEEIRIALMDAIAAVPLEKYLEELFLQDNGGIVPMDIQMRVTPPGTLNYIALTTQLPEKT